MSEVDLLSVVIALTAGLLSFVSPCVLPLVPVYLGYITGISAADLRTSNDVGRFGVIIRTVAFVFGLAVVFMLLGATATTAGRALAQYQPLITRLGGIAVIVFGLHTAGIVRIPWLARTAQGDVSRYHGRGAAGAALMGITFGAGWVPCVGPFLASILTLASQEHTAEQGMVLLFTYALGLGVPFLLVGLIWQPALRGIKRIQRWLGLIELLSGLLLVILGVLLVTDQYSFIAGRLTEIFGLGLTV